MKHVANNYLIQFAPWEFPGGKDQRQLCNHPLPSATHVLNQKCYLCPDCPAGGHRPLTPDLRPLTPNSQLPTQNPKLSPAPPGWVSERVRRARRAGKKALNFRMKQRPAGDGSQSISVAAGGFAAKPAQGCNWLKRSKLVRGEALVGRPVSGLRRRQFRSSIVRCLPGMSKIRHTRNEGPQGLGGQSAGGRFRLHASSQRRRDE